MIVVVMYVSHGVWLNKQRRYNYSGYTEQLGRVFDRGWGGGSEAREGERERRKHDEFGVFVGFTLRNRLKQVVCFLNVLTHLVSFEALN